MEGSDDNWMPLESNPEVINNYIKGLGFDTSQYCLVDLLSTDDWAQDMVPKPVVAIFFLYPLSEKQDVHRDKEAEKLKTNPQTISSNIFFMEQHAANACGTIAAFHSVVNIAKTNPSLIQNGSFFEKFIAATKDLDPKARGEYLKGSKDLEEAHKEAVQQGESEVEESVMTHFITFVEVDGNLYELDGTKDVPVNHGPCKSEEVLTKSCEVIKQFMERDPEEIRFTLMALAKAEKAE